MTSFKGTLLGQKLGSQRFAAGGFFLVNAVLLIFFSDNYFSDFYFWRRFETIFELSDKLHASVNKAIDRQPREVLLGMSPPDSLVQLFAVLPQFAINHFLYPVIPLKAFVFSLLFLYLLDLLAVHLYNTVY